MMPLLKDVTLLRVLCLVFVEGELERTFLLIALRIASELGDPSCDPVLVILDARDSAISRFTALLLGLESSCALLALVSNGLSCVV